MLAPSLLWMSSCHSTPSVSPRPAMGSWVFRTAMGPYRVIPAMSALHPLGCWAMSLGRRRPSHFHTHARLVELPGGSGETFCSPCPDKPCPVAYQVCETPVISSCFSAGVVPASAPPGKASKQGPNSPCPL